MATDTWHLSRQVAPLRPPPVMKAAMRHSAWISANRCHPTARSAPRTTRRLVGSWSPSASRSGAKRRVSAIPSPLTGEGQGEGDYPRIAPTIAPEPDAMSQKTPSRTANTPPITNATDSSRSGPRRFGRRVHALAHQIHVATRRLPPGTTRSPANGIAPTSRSITTFNPMRTSVILGMP